MPSECIIFGDSNGEVVFKEFEVDVLRCRRCDHMYSSYTTDQNYDEYFDGVEQLNDGVHWWDQAHRAMYDDFCSRYVANRRGKLLDVGCGLGYFVNKMKEFPNWESFGYEISAPAVQFAHDKLNLDNIFCGRVEKSSFGEAEFDIVTMWDVIEHLTQPDELLTYLHWILKLDGLLFMHTPNNRFHLPKARLKRAIRGMKKDVHYLEAKDHVNIYSMKSITKLLQRNGFKWVKFAQLKPIQAVSGGKSNVSLPIKNFWHYSSKMLFFATMGRVNFNNLFVAASK